MAIEYVLNVHTDASLHALASTCERAGFVRCDGGLTSGGAERIDLDAAGAVVSIFKCDRVWNELPRGLGTNTICVFSNFLDNDYSVGTRTIITAVSQLLQAYDGDAVFYYNCDILLLVRKDREPSVILNSKSHLWTSEYKSLLDTPFSEEAMSF